jgi:hypothetical protein
MRKTKTWIAIVLASLAVFGAIVATADTTTVTTATANTTILASTFNKIISALKVDFVPRNSSGVASAEAGSLGSTTYPWSQVFIGPTSAAVSIDENAGRAIIKVGGVSRLSVSTTGLSVDSIADSP